MKIQLNAQSIAIGLLAGGLAAGSITYAATNASGTTINACQSKTTGALRILSTGTCKTTEIAISWNSTGPQGVQGLKGDKGDRGEIGATGPQGTPGRGADRCSTIAGSDYAGKQWWACNFDNKSFRYANLNSASLAGASAIGADFTRASFKSADLSGIEATNAVFKRAVFDGGTVVVEANFEGADFSGSTIMGTLKDVVLRGVNLSDARIEATLNAVDFSNATGNASLAGSTAENVDFTNLPRSINLSKLRAATGSNFSGMDLTAVNWAPQYIWTESNNNVYFSFNEGARENFRPTVARSNFANAKLANVQLTFVDFSGANVQGTDFSGATFDGNICGVGMYYGWPSGMTYMCKKPTKDELQAYLCGLVGTPAALPNGWRLEAGCLRNW